MFLKILIIYFLCLAIYSKTNISNVFSNFGVNNLNQKNGCTESINQCVPLNKVLINSTCYNIKLPYEYTMGNNKDSIELNHWAPIKAIPKCWTYLQTLLCTLKYPECSKSHSEMIINKPARELCIATKRECWLLDVKNNNENMNKSIKLGNKFNHLTSIVERTPIFLDCDKYPLNCHVDKFKRMIPNTDVLSCQWPMVNSVSSTTQIQGFDGCSFYCKPPFYSKEEYQLTKLIFGTIGVVFFLFNLFVLATFIIHQFQHKDFKWHPMLLNLFIIHLYLLIASLGWMMQLLPGIGHSIVCRNDGTLQIRDQHIRVGESIWCVLVFSMIYFTLFASSLTSLSFFYSTLSVISQYSCCWTENENNNTQENLKSFNGNYKMPLLTKKIRFSLRKADNKKRFNFQTLQFPDLKHGTNYESVNARNHSLSSQLFVILISGSLLIISLTIGEIKGDPLSGICFVANDSMTVRICLSLLPLTIILVILSIIINIIIAHVRTIQKHLILYANSNQQRIHSKRMSKTATFYVFILIFLWLFWCFSVYTHIYIYNNEKLWFQALKNQLLCKLRQSLLPSVSLLDKKNEFMICPLEMRPSINVFILHNLSYFSINIVFLLCALFNRHFMVVWKIQFMKWFSFGRNCSNSGNSTTQTENNIHVEKLYFGLQNRSLLDSIWNPGIFVYLLYKEKKRHIDKDKRQITIEEKSATLGSTENSSASYCIYQHDGSLRSCVSMPPINIVGRKNIFQCSQNLSHESEICPTLENFLKGTQIYVGQNSVRRSNSYAGRPYLVAKSPLGNISIPNSCYHSESVNQQNSIFKDSLHNNSFISNFTTNNLMCSNNNCLQNCKHNFLDKPPVHTLNGCISMNNLTARRNTLEIPSSKSNKSLRRFSMTLDRKYEKGVSSKSSLNHRKRIARYSVSPKSNSKALRNNQLGTHNRLGDPSSMNSSSFSAESYNSYNLMSQQTGGRWRDICRTRMTLHDVMIWAKAASQNHMQLHNMCHNPCCNFSVSTDAYPHCNYTKNSNFSNLNKQCKCTTPHSMVYQQSNFSPNTFLKSDIIQSENPINLTDSNFNEEIQQKTNQDSEVGSNNSSDKFNSEDEIVSTGHSNKDCDRESGEFCSDDEVISLIDSDNPN